MRRRKASQRVGAPPNAATVRCSRCGTRLGVLWPTSYAGKSAAWDGFWTSATRTGATTDSGVVNLADEDWNEVTCSRCGFQWRGRNEYLHRLLRFAPGGEVRLGQVVPDRAPTSRSW